MSDWNSAILTKKGLNLQAKVEAGETLLNVTKIQLGSGILDANEDSSNLIALKKSEKDIEISDKIPQDGGLCTISGVISNQDINIGFYVKEMGLFATDPDEGEILYMYTTDNKPDYLPAKSTNKVVNASYNIDIAISNSELITAKINQVGLVTVEIMQHNITEHDSSEVAHTNLFKNLFNTTTVTAEAIKNKIKEYARDVDFIIQNFNNIEEMKQSNNLKSGGLIKTQGFYIAGDGGGADYVIVNDIGEDEADESSIITLKNRLYAKLLINDFVNIKQMGAKGDGETNETNIIRKILMNDDIKEVYFPKGTYIIKDSIDINRAIKIRGENRENTIIVSKDLLSYVTNAFIWSILITGSNIKFENIQLQQNITDTENKGLILGFKNTRDVVFKNCFIYQNEQDFGYVDLNTNNKNITFENCEFKTIIKTKTIKGTGCVMVREGYTEKVTENIYFNNCIFDHESADESIGVWDWFGTVKNVFLNNCTFNDANGTSISQHFITLNLKDKSVFLNNCIINRSGDNAFSIVKGGYGSNISNCIFNLNLSSLINGCFIGSPNINNCVINNKNSEGTLLDFNQLIDTDSSDATNEGFIMHNSEINGFRNFNHGKIFNSILDMQSDNVFDLVVGAEIELNNCTISNAKCQTFTNKPDSVNSLFKLINCTIQGNLQTNNFIILGENANINIQGTIIDVNNNFTITAPNSTGIIDYISYNNAFSNSINLGEKVINQIKNITE